MRLNNYGAECTIYKNFVSPCSAVWRSIGWMVLILGDNLHAICESKSIVYLELVSLNLGTMRSFLWVQLHLVIPSIFTSPSLCASSQPTPPNSPHSHHPTACPLTPAHGPCCHCHRHLPLRLQRPSRLPNLKALVVEDLDLLPLGNFLFLVFFVNIIHIEIIIKIHILVKSVSYRSILSNSNHYTNK